MQNHSKQNKKRFATQFHFPCAPFITHLIIQNSKTPNHEISIKI